MPLVFDTEVDGKLDILADSNFHGDFQRQSYKNALLAQVGGSGYQRVSNNCLTNSQRD